MLTPQKQRHFCFFKTRLCKIIMLTKENWHLLCWWFVTTFPPTILELSTVIFTCMCYAVRCCVSTVTLIEAMRRKSVRLWFAFVLQSLSPPSSIYSTISVLPVCLSACVIVCLVLLLWVFGASLCECARVALPMRTLSCHSDHRAIIAVLPLWEGPPTLPSSCRETRREQEGARPKRGEIKTKP